MAQAALSPDSGHRFVTTATEPPEHVLARYRALWTILFATLLPVAALDVGLEGQVWLAGLVVLAILTANLFEFGGFARLMVMLLAAFISVRYHAWRIFYTLPPVGAPGFIPGLLVYLAEVLTFVSFLLGLFVNIRPVQSRMAPIRLPALPPEQVPTVDVYVPTYNEEPELLRTTLLAATQIDYPAGRHTVYLLDDGGSEQKRGDKDPRQGRRGPGPPRGAEGTLRRARLRLHDEGAQRARQGRQPQRRAAPHHGRPDPHPRRRPHPDPGHPAEHGSPLPRQRAPVPGPDAALLQQSRPDRAQSGRVPADAGRDRDVLRRDPARARLLERRLLLRLGGADPAQGPGIGGRARRPPPSPRMRRPPASCMPAAGTASMWTGRWWRGSRRNRCPPSSSSAAAGRRA